MRNVFFQVSRVHHEVVHVDDEPSFCKVVSEDMVHEHLKGRRRVALAEKHNHRFIDLLNPNIVIPPPDIKFGEISGVFESVDEVENTRKGVSVLDCVRIYVAIILAGMECSILLWDKEEGGCLWRFRRKDFSFFEILVNECFQGLHFLRIE